MDHGNTPYPSRGIVLTLSLVAAACQGTAHEADAPRIKNYTCAGGVAHGDAGLSHYVGCTTVAGDLRIENVTTLEPLENLVAVDGTLQIGPTTRLHHLVGLEQLRGVKRLTLHGNARLISVSALNGLSAADQVRIVGNPLLSKSFGLLPRLKHALPRFELSRNAGLEAEGVQANAAPPSAAAIALTEGRGTSR